MKICFVALNAYPLISGDYSDKEIGGAQLQQSLIAKGLLELGHEVSFILMDHGQKDGQLMNGIRTFKSYKKGVGLPGIRFYVVKLPKIWQALKRANADIYYVRCAGFLPAILALFCKKYNKKFIFAGAHDTDFIPDKLLISTTRDKILYRYGLRRANVIILQTERQRRLLRENMGLDGIVIRNLPPSKEGGCSPNSQHGQYILWVSTIKQIKRPELFVNLAKKFSEIPFVMIGGAGPKPEDRRLYEKIEEECKKLKNIRFLGFLPYEGTEQYFDQAKIFVNTSSAEGFPNTFLQAWSRGIPVVSFVDPDNLIKKYNLGVVALSEIEFENSLTKILKSKTINQHAITDVFNKNFSREVILTEYDKLLKQLCKN